MSIIDTYRLHIISNERFSEIWDDVFTEVYTLTLYYKWLYEHLEANETLSFDHYDRYEPSGDIFPLPLPLHDSEIYTCRRYYNVKAITVPNPVSISGPLRGLDLRTLFTLVDPCDGKGRRVYNFDIHEKNPNRMKV